MKVFLLFLLVIGLAVAEPWWGGIRASRSADTVHSWRLDRRSADPVAVADPRWAIRGGRSADPMAVADPWWGGIRASRSADPMAVADPRWAIRGGRSADPMAVADPWWGGIRASRSADPME
ncbi:2-isopropylmalate synthase-like [Ornithodoros turicata]|uniref:2-isopropylmalate synthase-like n=1 Tax=Ornithodoros turicata TaxID=34597 RepID=UPI00313A0AE7